MSKKLVGKAAVVTGASKGIGAEIARQLAAEGAAVVVNYARSKEAAEKVVNEIKRGGGTAVAVQADVANPSDVKRLFAETKRAFDKLDILVNNAGIYEFAPLENVAADHFHKQFDLNVLGLILTSQKAAEYFDGDGGSIINVGSLVGRAPLPGAQALGGTALVRSRRAPGAHP